MGQREETIDDKVASDNVHAQDAVEAAVMARIEKERH
jgi:hypothetical protein